MFKKTYISSRLFTVIWWSSVALLKAATERDWMLLLGTVIFLSDNGCSDTGEDKLYPFQGLLSNLSTGRSSIPFTCRLGTDAVFVLGTVMSMLVLEQKDCGTGIYTH